MTTEFHGNNLQFHTDLAALLLSPQVFQNSKSDCIIFTQYIESHTTVVSADFHRIVPGRINLLRLSAYIFRLQHSCLQLKSQRALLAALQNQ